jgi:hypothetical protein
MYIPSTQNYDSFHNAHPKNSPTTIDRGINNGIVGWDVLYHYNTDEPPPDWTDWNRPLTSATNHIIARFISGTIGVATLPHHARLIAQHSLNAGGLGILDPRTHAIPDFMLTFTTSTRHATEYT